MIKEGEFENTNFESSNIVSNNNSKTENFDGQKYFRTSTKDDLIPSPITKNNNLKESQNNNDNINKNYNLFKIALFQFKRIMMIIYKKNKETNNDNYDNKLIIMI